MSSHRSDSYKEWQQRIRLLCQSAWRDTGINEPKLDRWLENFCGKHQPPETEQNAAFHLLQQFIYFGKNEIQECMRSLFRDHYVYPTTQELLNSINPQHIGAEIKRKLHDETCFLGVGNPAESGPGLLYDFRKVNGIPTHNFSTLESLFRRDPSGAIVPYMPGLRHIIFLDDLCATGDQVITRLSGDLRVIRQLLPGVKIDYFILFATSYACNILNSSKLFDDVSAVIKLEDDYRAFSPNSVFYFHAEGPSLRTSAEQICQSYGNYLFPGGALGYKNSQLMIGFEHNIPDNTLPIFWKSGIPDWYPIFPRAEKF